MSPFVGVGKSCFRLDKDADIGRNRLSTVELDHVFWWAAHVRNPHCFGDWNPAKTDRGAERSSLRSGVEMQKL